MLRARAVIQVAVGLVFRDDHVLIAKRHEHQHQGGLWEFPGGKIEADEHPLAALARELKEEVDLDVVAAQPLFTIDYDYPDKSVRLNIFKVTEFVGQANHREGQLLRWVPINELATIHVPAANQEIVNYILQQRK